MSYERERRSGNGCWTVVGNFLLLSLGGIILMSLLIMIGFWRTGDRFFDGLDTMFNAPAPTPQIDVRSVIVQQVRGVSELTTTIHTVEAIIPARQGGRNILGVEVGATTLLFVAVGEVRAGVDLSELGPENVEVISDTIRVRLPPPRLLDSKIDVNLSYVYDVDRGPLGLGPEATTLQTEAQRQGLSTIVAKACENGILDDANREAEVVVTQLLSVAGYQQVLVETQPPTADACPLPVP